MHLCNRGETLTRSVQENAANRAAATRARALICERPELFIGFGACGNRRLHASNFLADYSFDTVQKRCEDASRGVRSRRRVAFMVELWLSRPVRLSFGTQRRDWS